MDHARGITLSCHRLGRQCNDRVARTGQRSTWNLRTVRRISATGSKSLIGLKVTALPRAMSQGVHACWSAARAGWAPPNHPHPPPPPPPAQLGPPVVPFYPPHLAEGPPAKKRLQKRKGYSYSNLSTGGPSQQQHHHRCHVSLTLSRRYSSGCIRIPLHSPPHVPRHSCKRSSTG